jgi:hypothetical protein
VPIASESTTELATKKQNREFISIIYNQKNDSPKYFEIKKSKILYFFIGLPTITLLALILGVIGLVHTSPFHLIDSYRQNSLAREAVAKTNSLLNRIQKSEDEKNVLNKKIENLQEQLKTSTAQNTSTQGASIVANHLKNSPAQQAMGVNTSIGLASLSFFKPIQAQKDRTKPATLTLSGFKVVSLKDTINFQFNIIPAIGGEGKLAGHIIVVMKTDQGIQLYPAQAMTPSTVQINYESGEPFATQRFRPVDASFSKIKKSGNALFSIYIFAKNGDLLHTQSMILPVKL